MFMPRSEIDDWCLSRAKHWRLQFCFLPKRCAVTGKQLWGKRAYHGYHILTGPGLPIDVHFWIDKDEFLFWNLKNKK